MSNEPIHPWRIDTNDRYRETVTTVMGLSTASLLLPVFLARNLLGVPEATPLNNVFSSAAYWSWGLFGVSILSGILFCFFSAKWVRTAWGKPVSVLRNEVSENCIEVALEWFFWLTMLPFLAGLVLSIVFFVQYAGHA